MPDRPSGPRPSPTRLALALACLGVGLALATATARFDFEPVVGGPRVFRLGLLGLEHELARGDLLELVERAALPARLAWLAASLALGAWLARALARLAGAERAGLPFALAVAAALFLALDPGVLAFVAGRDFAGAPHYLEVEHALRGAGLALALVGALFALALSHRGARRPDAPTPPRGRVATSLALAGALAVVVPGVLSTRALDGGPLTNDGRAYQFEAELLAQGRAGLPREPLHAFFPARQVYPGSEAVPRVFGKYPPGHPLALAAGEALGEPRLLPWLGAALCPLLAFLLARRWGSPRPLLAAWLFALSPAWLSASALRTAWSTTVPAALAAMLLATLAIQRARQARTAWPAALAAGAALSVVGLARPGSAVALGAVLALAALLHAPRRALSVLAAAAAGAVPGVVAFLFFNRATTGDPLLPAYLLYARELSPNDTWGLANLATALPHTLLNLARLDVWSTGLGAGLLLAVLGRRFARPASPLAWLAWGAPLALLAFYALLTFHGIPWAGPVYLLEGLVGVSILTASGVHWLGSRLGRGAEVATLAAVGVASALALGAQWDAARREAAVRDGPRVALQRAGEGSFTGVVFVPLERPEDWKRYHLAPPSVPLREAAASGVLLARDLGEANATLLEALGLDERSARRFRPPFDLLPLR